MVSLLLLSDLELTKDCGLPKALSGFEVARRFYRKSSKWLISADPDKLACFVLFTVTDRVGANSSISGVGWGGARNRAVTGSLTSGQVLTLHSAALAAILSGLPFNRFVTVHWGKLGFSDADAARATGKLIKLASDWCSTKGIKMTWAWVRENHPAASSTGSHVHMLLHCPAGVPIGRKWRGWLRRVTGNSYIKGGVKSRIIGPSLGAYANNARLYGHKLVGVLNYLAKGVDPARGGHIVGKRAACWQQRRG